MLGKHASGMSEKHLLCNADDSADNFKFFRQRLGYKNENNTGGAFKERLCAVISI